MRLVFAGTPALAVPALDALVESRHEVLAVITRPDAPRGRGKRLSASPVAERAAELGLEILTPRRPGEPEFQARLRELAPDCCPIVAYGALIPAALLGLPTHGWINLHFSLLPRWRGAAPVQRAVLAGDRETGAVTFELVAELDAGAVYDRIVEPIGERDTSGDLLERLAGRGAGLLVQTLDRVSAGARPTPQPTEGITLAPKLGPADGRLDWARPAAELDRQIRACTPAPGPWSMLRGQRFKVLQAAIAAPGEPPDVLPPGVLAAGKRELLVGTADRPLRLERVQAFGKPAMAGADWARGAGLKPGEGFETTARVEANEGLEP